MEERGWNECRMYNNGNNRCNWRISKVVRKPINGRNDYRGNCENSRQEEISGSRAIIDFRRMIEDLTIEDFHLEMEIKMIILVEGTTEIGVRVKILVDPIEGKEYDCMI
ncbi:hypothetical protein TNCV_3471911 [Trichonephila clavipes]|nr:hypothetical protein TNCV_3471911 [Trichonephila clavipes]